MAIIVDDPDLGIVEGNLISHDGNGTPCQYLTGDSPGEYGCNIHDRRWYPETPCYDYDQIGQNGDKCRMGVYILAKEKGNAAP